MKIALVTGANQGIGYQIAKELVGRGLTVYVGSRNLARGAAAAKELGGRPLQLDVTDRGSIAAAAAQIEKDFGRLDVLVQNAAISNTQKDNLGLSLAAYGAKTRASNCSIDEMRAVWDVNVFGVLAVHQAMLPLLRAAPTANIVMVSSGAGSMTRNLDPSNPHRTMFGPIYSGSKAAMNVLAVAMALELEGSTIKVNAVSPGFTKTNLNGYEGVDTLEQGASEAVKMALIGPDGPHGGFTHATLGALPW